MSNLLRRCAQDGAVLCFHGIVENEHSSAGATHMTAEAFEQCLGVALRLGEIVPLSELIEWHQTGRRTGGLLAITFDDAYRSLLPEAVDSLRRYMVPITIFVSTDFAARGGRFWWDRLDDLYPSVPPERWKLFEDALGLPQSFRDGQPAAFGPLRPLRQWMLAEHHGRVPPEVEDRLAALEEEMGFGTLQRSMTYSELNALTEELPVDVGVHTASHPVLPLLPDNEIRAEIDRCMGALAEHFQTTSPILAAPYGLLDERTVRIARESGMLATLSVANGTLRQAPARDVLPRFVITAGEKRWKLGLKLAGVVERARELAGRHASSYPALPSATT
jgi:peptidoglycan/xylan/chitin deacetylase (PgdA/CDA1 family)